MAGAGRHVVADEVDAWLEERSLTRLLAEHLEQRIEKLSGESRADAKLRLAKLYAVLLADSDDPAVEERARRLEKEVGPGADDLRLVLHQGSYSRIERDAERHRIRVLDEDQLPELLGRIEALIDKLNTLHGKIKRSLQRVRASAGQRSVGRSNGSSKLAELEQMFDQINFLMGWCRYYQAWLTDSVGPAEQAERHFSQVLDLKEMLPRDVSQDLLPEQAIAWTVIGMAMAQSMTSSTQTAMQWLDLLDSPNVASAIRSQLPGWRLAVLLQGGEFERAARILSSAGETLERPIGWTRMAVVHSLEQSDNPAADALAAEALADLASIAALDQIQDIVNRYEDLVEERSFPFGYARAVIKYRYAQELQDKQSDVSEADLRDAWRQAADAIAMALQAEDASRFDAARYQAIHSHAWSLYHLGKFEMSRKRFESASEFLPEMDAAEAIWMAYVSEERRCEADRTLPRADRDRLVNLYLERFPEGPRAVDLKFKGADQDDQLSMARVKELLAVRLDSSSRNKAERYASLLLYRLFRESKPAGRLDVASEYLAIAVPIMQEDYASSDRQ
ncbi:MAG: hypothetical protein MK100_10045, partial [Phycisphaerales bacterium]|nr:hypothetical protein [Phycisphaerales bacterium]